MLSATTEVGYARENRDTCHCCGLRKHSGNAVLVVEPVKDVMNIVRQRVQKDEDSCRVVGFLRY